MTPAQLTTLKTNILAPANDAALDAFITAEDWPSIALFYNAPSGSTVWKPNVTARELTSVIVGSAFDALSVQKQNGYFAVISGGVVDATQASIRAWFQDIFGAGATLTALTAMAQKPATRFEMLFSTPATPSNVTVVFGRIMNATDVQMAMLQG